MTSAFLGTDGLIKAAAERTGYTTSYHTVRLLCAKGVLAPKLKDSGHKLFSRTDVNRLVNWIESRETRKRNAG